MISSSVTLRVGLQDDRAHRLCDESLRHRGRRPSSATSMTISAPSRCRRIAMRPTAGLPAACLPFRRDPRCHAQSELRSMCSNGGSILSRTCRSSSPDAPFDYASSARLPDSSAACRTSLVRRPTWRSNGTMRVRMRPSCNSAVTRDCWTRRLSDFRQLRTRSKSFRLREIARRLRQVLATVVEWWNIDRAQADQSLCATSVSWWLCMICASVSFSSFRKLLAQSRDRLVRALRRGTRRC